MTFSLVMSSLSSNDDDHQTMVDGESDMNDEPARDETADSPAEPKQKKRKKGRQPRVEVRRGCKMTCAKRMLQFPGEFIQQGSDMWCIACQAVVDFRQSTTAKHHLASERHRKNKQKMAKQVISPGPSAVVPNPPEQSQPSTSSSQGLHAMLFCTVSPPTIL